MVVAGMERADALEASLTDERVAEKTRSQNLCIDSLTKDTPVHTIKALEYCSTNDEHPLLLPPYPLHNPIGTLRQTGPRRIRRRHTI